MLNDYLLQINQFESGLIFLFYFKVVTIDNQSKMHTKTHMWVWKSLIAIIGIFAYICDSGSIYV